MRATDLLDFSGQSMLSFSTPRSGHTPGAAAAQSSTPCSDTPVVDILSEARVSIDPSDVDPDPDNTIVKIMSVKKKDLDPDTRKRQDPQ